MYVYIYILIYIYIFMRVRVCVYICTYISRTTFGCGSGGRSGQPGLSRAGMLVEDDPASLRETWAP